jgi:hypothetical protein
MTKRNKFPTKLENTKICIYFCGVGDGTQACQQALYF